MRSMLRPRRRRATSPSVAGGATGTREGVGEVSVSSAEGVAGMGSFAGPLAGEAAAGEAAAGAVSARADPRGVATNAATTTKAMKDDLGRRRLMSRRGR